MRQTIMVASISTAIPLTRHNPTTEVVSPGLLISEPVPPTAPMAEVALILVSRTGENVIAVAGGANNRLSIADVTDEYAFASDSGCD